MAETLSFQIQTVLVNQQFNDNGGNWQYVGADLVEQASMEAVKLIAMKRENSTCGVNFAASMLTASVMYPSQENGVSEHFTIQGLHDLKSNNETGNVTSASRRFAEYVGGRFFFDFTEKVLTVWPRER
jgi:hypothetical protein